MNALGPRDPLGPDEYAILLWSCWLLAFALLHAGLAGAPRWLP